MYIIKRFFSSHLFVGCNLIFGICMFGELIAQDIPKNKNGFIYDEITMNNLSYIVDSLNSGFKRCDLDRTYYSLPIAKVHAFTYKGNIPSSIRKAIKQNMSYEELVTLHPKLSFEENQYVYYNEYVDWEDAHHIRFNELSLGSRSTSRSFDLKYSPDVLAQKRKGTWMWDQSSGSFQAIYFITEFERQELPKYYARMIQYSECLIDTNHTVYKEGASSGRESFYGAQMGSEINSSWGFIAYINESFGNIPELIDENYDLYYKEYDIWDSLRTLYIEDTLSKTDDFKKRVVQTVRNCLKNNESNREFEELVARYYSKPLALELKRGRKVYGRCSMDSSPRNHAKKIAELAAVTTNWNVFLRSHLDIMNDRFERTAYSSYGEARFGTYIPEIEALNINVPDLVFGISLRADNVGENHYFGNINRMGRALSETKYVAEMESRMKNAIADPQLDMFNRVYIYFMYLNYIGHMTNAKDIERNRAYIEEALKSMPENMAKELKW